MDIENYIDYFLIKSIKGGIYYEDKVESFFTVKIQYISLFDFWLVAGKILYFSPWKTLFILNKKEKQIISNAVVDVIGNIKRGVDIEEVTKRVFRGIFSHYYEKLFIAFEEKEKATKFLYNNISSADLVVIRRCLLKGKGVIVITGHYGAIEYIPTLLAVNYFDISMIAKFKTEQLKKKVFSQAEKYKIRLIDAENAGDVLKAAIKELKENRVLVTQCDEIEEWRPPEKKKTSFLGQVTGLDRTINIIQKRTGAEVVFGVIHRYNLSEYKLMMYSYEDMLKMLEGIPLSTVGETVLKVLEQLIYHYPEQWYQWKKYPELRNNSIIDVKAAKPISSPFLQPAFGKVL
jgi:lauroyl/myristoyl acyltransferase